MASGLLVVAPDAGGLLSYANEENAWLVEAEPKSFAWAIQSVFADENRRREKTENALKTAKKYTWKSLTDALFRLYDRMCAEFTRNNELYVYKKNAGNTDFLQDEVTEM